jgi:hypothetical protein
MTPSLRTIPIEEQTSLSNSKKPTGHTFSANYNFLVKNGKLLDKHIKYLDYLMKVIRFQSGILPKLTQMFQSLMKVKLYFELLKEAETSLSLKSNKQMGAFLNNILNVAENTVKTGFGDKHFSSLNLEALANPFSSNRGGSANELAYPLSTRSNQYTWLNTDRSSLNTERSI